MAKMKNSQDKPTRRGLTRRSFLKTTGVATGILAATGAPALSLQALANDYGDAQIPGEGEQIFRGVCRPNCFGFCHLNVHVRDGNVVKTSRAPYNNPAYDRICQRGLSHVQRVYNPNRIKYPMRRVEGTERGAGEWERISWDEAITEIAEKMQYYMGEYGSQSIALSQGSYVALTNTYSYVRLQFALGLTSISTAYDQASSYGLSRMTGPGTGAWEANEQTDLINAKSIVVWGANVTDAQVQQWHLMNEAKQNGSKLVVIDPIYTQIAAKADKWIRIRPGADAALILGIIKEIFDQKILDEEYLMDHTVAPFLVRKDTGTFLRGSDIGIDPVDTGEVNIYTQEPIMFDEALVLENGKLVPAGKAKLPELFASHTHEGIKCDTALSLLQKSVQEYTLPHVSELTEIPEETIRELIDISVDTPVSHYVGYGPQAYTNGAHATHAGLTMCALLGNIGKPGATWGSYWMMFGGINAAYTVGAGYNAGATINVLAWPEVMRTQKWQGEDCVIKMAYLHSGNPLCCGCDTNEWLTDIFDNLEYIVTADIELTDTARHSDLILPVAHWFEYPEVTNAGQTTTINLSEKATDPLYESKSDVEIIHLIAEKFGLGDFFSPDSEEVLTELLASDACKALGATYDDLKEKKEARWTEDEPHIAFKDGVFSTGSGRLEFYVENPTPREMTQKEITPELIEREHLPRFFPPVEAWPESEMYQKYPLICLSERPRFRVHSQWFDTPLLRELDPEPYVKINPIDAEKRSISDGDYVECYNDRGHVVAKAVYSEAIRPGLLVYPKGWQSYQHKAGCWSELLSSGYDPFTVNCNFMDMVCEVRRWKEGE